MSKFGRTFVASTALADGKLQRIYFRPEMHRNQGVSEIFADFL